MTPAGHRDVLVEPPGPTWVGELAAGGTASRPEHANWLGRPLAAWQAECRRSLDLAGPVVATGHQVEFFHAGVLAKVIAAHALAERVGGCALFLTVDCDQPHGTELLVPQVASRGVRRVSVRVPGLDPRRPFEDQPGATRAEWLQFFASVTSLHEFGDRSLLPVFARAWLTTSGGLAAAAGGRESGFDAVEAMSRAHAASQAAIGLEGVREVRVSRLCTTPAFRAFAAAMLLNAHRAAEDYNTAVADYRRRHRVRTRGRPVPPLEIEEDRIEMPFWVVRRGEPRRRLHIAAKGDSIQLFAEQEEIGQLERAELAAPVMHDCPWPLEEDGWRIRPRALTLSAFARLFVADFFIHGIGGAKYDEITEDFIGAWGGGGLAPAGCVSATLQLPLPHSGIRAADIARARHAGRDVRHNPQRHLPRVPDELRRDYTELVRRSDELRAQRSNDRAARAVIFRELRRVKAQMLATDPWRTAQYDQRATTLEAQRALDRVALDREYFYALHPPESLLALVGDVKRALSSATAE